ncbi:MAG: hypothetical protein AAF593_00195 [Planctomycetota bacterium]
MIDYYDPDGVTSLNLYVELVSAGGSGVVRVDLSESGTVPAYYSVSDAALAGAGLTGSSAYVAILREGTAATASASDPARSETFGVYWNGASAVNTAEQAALAKAAAENPIYVGGRGKVI